jgi:hypothetical protein
MAPGDTIGAGNAPHLDDPFPSVDDRGMTEGARWAARFSAAPLVPR